MEGMRPEALSWSAENCTVGRAMAILGEKWTVVVLREVFVGIRRFDDMRVADPDSAGRSSPTASPRWSSTACCGASPIRMPGARARDEYRLTERGSTSTRCWWRCATGATGTWLTADGPPMITRHRDCGAEVHAVMRCEWGHEVDPRGVTADARPGHPPSQPGDVTQRVTSVVGVQGGVERDSVPGARPGLQGAGHRIAPEEEAGDARELPRLYDAAIRQRDF